MVTDFDRKKLQRTCVGGENLGIYQVFFFQEMSMFFFIRHLKKFYHALIMRLMLYNNIFLCITVVYKQWLLVAHASSKEMVQEYLSSSNSRNFFF